MAKHSTTHIQHATLSVRIYRECICYKVHTQVDDISNKYALYSEYALFRALWESENHTITLVIAILEAFVEAGAVAGTEAIANSGISKGSRHRQNSRGGSGSSAHSRGGTRYPHSKGP